MKNKSVLDILIAAGIFGLFIIPLLIPYSYFPVVKFYSEIVALVIAAVTTLLVSYKVERISISSAGIAALLFALLLLLQIGVVDIHFPGVNIVIAIELLVVGLFSIAITSLIAGNDAKHERLFLLIAWAVVISATIQAFYGLLQYTHQADNFQGLILAVNVDLQSIVGNVGQKNDYADLITMGVFALAYLFFVRQVNLIVFLCYELFFLAIITLTLSRTSFAYFILAFIITCIYAYIKHKKVDDKHRVREILFIIFALFIGLFIVEALLPKILELFTHVTLSSNTSAPAAFDSGLSRFSDKMLENQVTYRRFYEWYKDIIIFAHHPLFGVGWFQYPHAGIYIMNTDARFMYIPANTALYTHSHNSPLNILAETGIIGFAIAILYGVFYSVVRMFKNFDNYTTLFASFLILTIFTQSLFQYPLWYAYFLVYFVLFLSLDKPIITFKNTRVLQVVLTAVVIGFMAFCWVNTQMYNRVVNYSAVPSDADDFAANVTQLTQIVDNNLLWSFPALSVLDNYIMPTTPQTNGAMSPQDQAKYIDMLGSELPYAGEIFKQIIIHKVIGDEAGAMYYAHLLAHAYPALKGGFAQQLSTIPAFAPEVAEINGFQYQEHSIFSEYFKRNK